MRISIVVLSYGAPDLALECLESIEKTDQRSIVELILVDNGSTPHQKSDLQERLHAKGIRVNHFVDLPENLGFSRGMNAGIAFATGDLVIALNSDTVVGRQLPTILSGCALKDEDRVAFLAVSIYDAERSARGLTKTRRVQADVCGLTWYMSVMPVRIADIQARYILGPFGAAVVMTRRFVQQMIAKYGFVYDPAFFFYGEDVDLFLRARRAGYRTQFVEGSIDRDEGIWHIGSATASNTGVRTLDKPPEIAAHVLNGCLRNSLRHSGVLEFVPALISQVCFHCVFWSLYARKHSISSTIRLVVKSRIALPRLNLERPSGLFLTSLVSVLYRNPSFWARTTPATPNRAHVSAVST
jgi:GT2 family glycosyltransferase